MPDIACWVSTVILAVGILAAIAYTAAVQTIPAECYGPGIVVGMANC